MNILSGTYPYGSAAGILSTTMDMLVPQHQKDISQRGERDCHLAIRELALIPGLSVAEKTCFWEMNARATGHRLGQNQRGSQKWLDMVAFKEEATRLVKDVGIGAQQLIEIAKALAKNVKLLILDEPSDGVRETEARRICSIY